MRKALNLLMTTTLAVGVWAGGAMAGIAQEEGTGGRCVPMAERGQREFGCYVLAREQIGALPAGQIYWHIDAFPDLATAQAAAGPRGVAVEAFGASWLLTIEEGGWRSNGGERVAEIGPLPVGPADAFTAQYMEATFRPGMKSGIAQRSGPEAWHTLSGESCLETPEGTFVGRAGGEPVIAPAGVPMQVTATGLEIRRALVLVLHDSSKPAATPVTDWQPKGLCGQ
jgi:quercetin dioxygenase-like cupin family protein